MPAARDQRGARIAQIAFDHRQPIDDMAERVVHGLERILGLAVAVGLAETDIGQLALDEFGKAGILRRMAGPAAFGQRCEAGMLGFEMAQDVLQAVLDAAEIAGAVIGGGLEAFEQIGHALLEMGEGGGAVIGDGHPIDAVGQRPQRAFDLFGVFAGRRPLAALQRRGQGGDALLQHGEGIAVVAGAGKLVDLGRERVHVVAEPRQRVGGGDVGDDGAKRGDGAFELVDRRGVVAGAQDGVEPGAETADRLVVAGQLFRRLQRAQRFANLVERAFDARQGPAIDTVLPGVVDAAGQRPDLVFDQFDRPARHRLGDGGANLGQFDPEGGDRRLDPAGVLQRFDLAGDLEKMTLERGEIGPGRRCRRCRHGRRQRRRTARRHCRGAALSSSLWRAAISATASSSEPGLSGGDGR